MLESRFDLSLVDLSDLLGVSRPSVMPLVAKAHQPGAVARPAKTLTAVPPQTVRRILERKGYKYQSRCIAFQVIKGGVGKTTLAKNFGIRAAQYGYKVLFVDFDHQANLTYAFDQFDAHNRVWIDFVRGKVPDVRALVKPVTETIGLIPSALANARLDAELVTNTHNLRNVVGKPLEQLRKDYDLIICDCPPALGPSVSAVYLAVDQVIAPVVTDKFSEMGIEFMFEEWKILSQRFERAPEIRLLINRHDPRLKSSNAQLLHLVSNYSDYMLPTTIRASADFLATTNANQHLWEVRRGSPAAEDVDAVVRQVLELTSLAKSTPKRSARNVEATDKG